MPDAAAQAAPADLAARRALVQELADALGEAERGPRALLARVVATLGADRTRAFLAEALAVEDAGGLPLPDGSRRRTPGGVFCHLVRRGVDREARRRIFPPGSQRAPGWGGGGAAPATRAVSAGIGSGSAGRSDSGASPRLSCPYRQRRG